MRKLQYLIISTLFIATTITVTQLNAKESKAAQTQINSVCATTNITTCVQDKAKAPTDAIESKTKQHCHKSKPVQN